MRVLYVYRGSSFNLRKPVVENQVNAIQRHSEIELIPCIIKKGGIHYLLYPWKIRKLVKREKINIVHAHYSISGFFASLAFSGAPVVCSLMGSDIWDKTLSRLFVPLFNKYFWRKTVVKSIEMQQIFPNAIVIPNGIDFSLFKPLDKSIAYNKTGFSQEVRNIIFVTTVANMAIKNIELAKNVVQLLKQSYKGQLKLHILDNIEYDDMPYYYNAADVLLLTSFKEGSPNVVKEALACNCAVVSTDVGDVRKLISNIEGCYIASFNESDVANKIKMALDNHCEINGRNSIKHLANDQIVSKMIELYNSLI